MSKNNIVAHLIIIGVEPTNQEWAIALSKNSTIKVPIADASTIHEQALVVAKQHLNVDQRFLIIEASTFIQVAPSGPIHLIFKIKIPQNIKLYDAEWVSASKLSEYCKEDEELLKVIAEAVNYG